MASKFSSILIAGIFSLLFLSGNLHGQKAGGSCSYKKTVFPARIIKVDVYDSAAAEIIFVVDHYGGTDTLSYYSVYRKFATSEDIEKYDLRVGNVVCYEEYHITSGSCSPYYTKLKLDKYVTPPAKKD